MNGVIGNGVESLLRPINISPLIKLLSIFNDQLLVASSKAVKVLCRDRK